MLWNVHLAASCTCIVLTIVFAIIRNKTTYKRGRILDVSKILVIGVAFSAWILFVPIYDYVFQSGETGFFKTLLASFHNVIRLFVVDGEFKFITDSLTEASSFIYNAYAILFATYFILAPILTFGFVLSFSKNLSARKRYITHFFSQTFVFSQLNERSLALAKSLYKNGKQKRFFVFTDVCEDNEAKSFELIEKAKELGAILFKKDIDSINFSFHSKGKNRGLNFCVISEDQTRNIAMALSLVERYKYRKRTKLFVFSTQVESEILLSNAFNGVDNDKKIEIKVRRINEVRSLISRNLYDQGYEKIFKSAYDDGSGVKKINAVIIGMGRHGTEMVKALSWFCQMDGYLAEINSFDISKTAEETFTSLCPELMEMSGKTDIVGESKYTINIHSGIDVNTSSFDKIVVNLPRTTYILVALGNDEKNISIAVKLRSLFERIGYHPEIQAVVHNSDKKEALNGASNFKGQKYDIDFIGDISTSYSEEVILYSNLETVALKRHLAWGEESAFWRYDYNYNSSVASAIHRKMKSLCGIPGIDKQPSERTEEELWNIRVLEHCRWNAYMRSEGYVYGGTIERAGRNDLAKMHNCLVPFDELTYEEKIKDDN